MTAHKVATLAVRRGLAGSGFLDVVQGLAELAAVDLHARGGLRCRLEVSFEVSDDTGMVLI